MKRFPFDDQLCFLKFGSWTYDSTQIILTNRSQNVDMLNYVNNGKSNSLHLISFLYFHLNNR
jgi:nicotinic acetylcholine receptor